MRMLGQLGLALPQPDLALAQPGLALAQPGLALAQPGITLALVLLGNVHEYRSRCQQQCFPIFLVRLEGRA